MRGEEIIDAAEREIREEIGISELHLIATFEPYTRERAGQSDGEEKEMKTIHMFLFDTSQDTFVLTDLRHEEARWVHVEKVSILISHPRDKEFFESIKDSLK